MSNIRTTSRQVEGIAYALTRLTQVARHLRNIRLIGPQGQLGGNPLHPQDDALWDTADVVALLEKRVVMSEEEVRQRAAARSKEIYRQAMEEKDILRKKVEAQVAEGTITQEEGDKLMISRLPGQYRTAYREEIAERKRKAGEMQYEELRTNAGAVHRKLGAIANYSDSMRRNLVNIFNHSDQVTAPNHLQRNGIYWPTSPSIASFYLIYAVGVPMPQWPPEGLPVVSQAFSAASLFLHPDKGSHYQAAFGSDPNVLTNLYQVFSASRDVVIDYLDNGEGAAEEKNAYLHEIWNDAKFAVQQAMLPKTNMFPPFFISHLLDEAAAQVARADAKRQQNEENEPE